MTDTRIGLNTTYEKPYTSISRGIYGLSGSAERDFYSMGANYTYERDYHQKNTVLAFGVSPEFDAVKPHGGLPGEYSTLLSPEEKVGTRDGKYLVGGLIGITQIINPRTLMQWNYAPTYENGYLNDPYKLLSVTNANGDPLNSIHEKRPGSRLQHSFFWLTRYNFVDQDVFSLGLRYFADDWGIRSQTIDFHYRWQYHPKHFLEPHIRYYHQTAAGFYRSGLLNTDPLPAHASADYRLTDLDGVTFGLAVGWTFKNESELVMRAEYYTLSGEDSPNDAVGAQQAFDLFPTIHAAIIQFDYRFEPSKVFHRKGGF